MAPPFGSARILKSIVFPPRPSIPRSRRTVGHSFVVTMTRGRTPNEGEHDGFLEVPDRESGGRAGRRLGDDEPPGKAQRDEPADARRNDRGALAARGCAGGEGAGAHRG